MLYKDGRLITEIRREDPKDEFVVEFDTFKKEYEAYCHKRGGYELEDYRIIPPNNYQNLPEPRRRAQIEMKVSKVGTDGTVHDYMWLKNIPLGKDKYGNQLLKGSELYWLYKGRRDWLTIKDVEVAFFLFNYSGAKDKIFRVRNPELVAKTRAMETRKFLKLDSLLYGESGLAEDVSKLNVLADELGLGVDNGETSYEVANRINDAVYNDIEAKGASIGLFDRFVELVADLNDEGGVPTTQEEVEALSYSNLKKLAGVSKNISAAQLVKDVCDKLHIDYEIKEEA